MYRNWYIFQAVTAPMTTLNAIAVEAYKKYILVSLIVNGQVCYLLAWLFFYATKMHHFLTNEPLPEYKFKVSCSVHTDSVKDQE